MNNDGILDLFNQYATNSDYEFIIMGKFMNVVYSIIDECKTANVNVNELYGLGNVVLIMAIRIYDEKRHGSFTDFLTNLIIRSTTLYMQDYDVKSSNELFNSIIQEVLSCIMPDEGYQYVLQNNY